MSLVTVTVPALFVRALEQCAPAPEVVRLLEDARRDSTDGLLLLFLNRDQAERLADAAGHVWWECVQAAGDADDFAAVFSVQARKLLDDLAAHGIA